MTHPQLKKSGKLTFRLPERTARPANTQKTFFRQPKRDIDGAFATPKSTKLYAEFG
ncbi:MAG: hypothetical protein Q4B82_07955 [Alysiella sp.]|uniref:hypothetical protein n=1 Tax=Alysiella sp. TaxID=1872483 RepID=UPI0026DB9202|nr:hypothetical protein [Alysiella sp.]MDO4434495.1 hypothetical protein [Alysiella sp.]